MMTNSSIRTRSRSNIFVNSFTWNNKRIIRSENAMKNYKRHDGKIHRKHRLQSIPSMEGLVLRTAKVDISTNECDENKAPGGGLINQDEKDVFFLASPSSLLIPPCNPTRSLPELPYKRQQRSQFQYEDKVYIPKFDPSLLQFPILPSPPPSPSKSRAAGSKYSKKKQVGKRYSAPKHNKPWDPSHIPIPSGIRLLPKTRFVLPRDNC
ncbi:unnamed protein product [Pseudo-nitzschia multistriata]|uniref:Uncharacterized protein n=1 Tax=Pseudo-nitzschia multistriata TaxID=183589 RepID=A0A448ZS06_9STRA|nr:unnamed protein product [Pseudo-nitzschia multistriata]